ncbi:MAG: Rpn family recombination-promoting nuclease/putative transposase [Lachnospiraceae bacterium]|nr:Rpn family recombination-promoting nuclease/putative transposase [Lachnospiraceae bacterium]
MSNDTTKHFRPLSDLNLLDDFLFQEMLAQEDIGEEFCRILLKTILGKPIRKVRIIPQKNVLGLDTRSHGIRLDAYIQDVSDTDSSEPGTVDADILPDIYDIESNKHFEKASLPKRMRYYHGLIDTQLLSTGTSYSKLPNVVIIFILPYDPFDRNRIVYTIKNQCIEDPTIPYEDGALKILLYTKGILDGHPENTGHALRDMLKYMEKSTITNVTNSELDTIHRLVSDVKSRKEVGINYMKSWELEQMHRDEGHAEGYAKGQQDGLQKGILALITTCRKFSLSEQEILSEILTNFSISEKEAQEYINMHKA